MIAVPAKLPKRPEPKRLNLGAAVMHPGWLLEIKGWAAAPPDARVVLRADGELLGEAVRGMVRKDVLKENPWIGTDECGFGLVRPHVAMGHAVQVSAVVLSASGEVLDHATRVYDLVELAKARPAKPPSWWRSGGMKFLREAGSSLVHGWAAGAPVPFLLEGFAGPRRVWLQGGRARPDVMGKLEGFPQQTPGFSAHLGPEESWMLEAAGAFTLVGYSRAGALHRVRARHCVLACYNMIIPYLLRDLSAEQSHALAQNVKFPLVYTKVVIRNWQSFMKLGVHEIYAPSQPYSRVKLDYPVDIGGYSHPRDPNQPIGLHMVYVPTSPNTGMDARTQARVGRGKLYGMSFEYMEGMIRDQLQAMLGPVGFDHQKDIQAITINRWSHGYSYFSNSLFDDEQESEKLMNLARTKVGNVTIANSDAAWDAYAHAAIDEAWRAVGELS